MADDNQLSDITIQDLLAIYVEPQKSHERFKRNPGPGYKEYLEQRSFDYMKLDSEKIKWFHDQFKDFFQKDTVYNFLDYVGLSKENILIVQHILVYGCLITLVLYSGVYQYPLSFGKIILKELLDLLKRLIVVLWAKLLDWVPYFFLFLGNSIYFVLINYETIYMCIKSVICEIWQITKIVTFHLVYIILLIKKVSKLALKNKKSVFKKLKNRVYVETKRGEDAVKRMIGIGVEHGCNGNNITLSIMMICHYG